MDVAAGTRAEATEAELTRLIEKRAATGDGDPEACDELWKASVRRYRDRVRGENRAAWRGWHLEQAERIERAAAELAEGHRRRAGELTENRQKEAQGR